MLSMLLLLLIFHGWSMIIWTFCDFCLKWWKWSCCYWLLMNSWNYALIVVGCCWWCEFLNWVLLSLSCCCCCCCVELEWIEMLLLKLLCFKLKSIQLLHKLFWVLWKELIWCIWALGQAFNHFGWMGDKNKHFGTKLTKTRGWNTSKRAFRSAGSCWEPAPGRSKPEPRRNKPDPYMNNN